MSIDIILLKNSIRLLIGGWLHDGGEVTEVLDILKEMVQDYSTEIDRYIEE